MQTRRPAVSQRYRCLPFDDWLPNLKLFSYHTVALRLRFIASSVGLVDGVVASVLFVCLKDCSLSIAGGLHSSNHFICGKHLMSLLKFLLGRL